MKNIFNNKDKKICIFSLTYNRPSYIKRSFNSLYSRAGLRFDHFVFDDGSDKETLSLLRDLKKKYNFKLFLDKKRKTIGIYKRFLLSINKIPQKYDYYVKFDSDVEILSDNFFKEALDVFSFPLLSISCLSPRIEGIQNFDRNQTVLDFYNNHAVRFDSPIVSGCCLILSKETFISFPFLTEKKIIEFTENWGADLMLYNHAKQIGKCAVIEDLSVYHIDNAYGQRRMNYDYFMNRKRWERLDVDQVWYLLASREIYPNFIKRKLFDAIRGRSDSYQTFLSLSKKVAKNPNAFENDLEQLEEQKRLFLKDKKSSIIKQEDMTKEMYKITSPLNFKPCEYILHGESKYFAEIPKWAINNPSVVIEKELVSIANTSKKDIEKLEDISKKTGKSIKKCKECGYQTTSFQRMKTHKEKKHGIIK